MSRFHLAGMVLAGTVMTVLSTAGVMPAGASTVHLEPPPGGLDVPVVRTVVVGGMPGWQIALIATAAALVAAAAAVLADRVFRTRSRSAAS